MSLKLQRKKKESNHEVSRSKVFGTRGSRRDVVVIVVAALPKYNTDFLSHCSLVFSQDLSGFVDGSRLSTSNKRILVRVVSTRGLSNKNARDKSDASGSFSISTMESVMTRGGQGKGAGGSYR
jgi:hypothetical protein